MFVLKPPLRLVISLAFVMALVAAPVIPAMAFVSQHDQSHAAHEGPVKETGHASPQQESEVNGCTGTAAAGADCEQHDFCNGQCCATCVQCFTAALMVFPHSTYSHSIQAPIVQRLRVLFRVAVRHRPPRAI